MAKVQFPQSFLAIPLIAILLTFSHGQSTINPTDKYAWGQNTGWINCRPNSLSGLQIAESCTSGFAWCQNIGWINFGNGLPANGYAYTNTTGDHGINHDGAGNLTGYAWSQNTGWVNFGWATLGNPDAPSLNLLTGILSGYAWSPNIGWISLESSVLRADSLAMPDSDGDGISDHWENLHFGNLTTANALTNSDSDGPTDLQEYLADTDPNDSDNFLVICSSDYNTALNTATITFTSKPTRVYSIGYSNDIGQGNPWTDSNLGTFLPSAGASTTQLINFPTHHKKFYRVSVKLPLSP